MLFNSFTFLFFFLPITYVGFWLLKTANQRFAWLAVTGYVFYSFWNPWFCLLMAFTTLTSFLAGLIFLKEPSPAARTLVTAASIGVDLLVLGFFKYAKFFVSALNSVFAALGLAAVLPYTVPVSDSYTLDLNAIVLPVGISFYTFHTISYIIDCKRRVVTPTRNILEYAAYVSLFSQLVAGPIVRFRQIEVDLLNLGRADRTRWLGLSVSFFLAGLVQKVLVADTFAGFVDASFERPDTWSSAHAWITMLGYAFQIYYDFAGYSNMALGLGYLFGLRIPINFNSPYKAVDPSDFWRRWHISLSSCLRDYVYIPLGGSRFGTTATYRNLLLTMLIGGLWHGANWTFVVWGAYHGALLCLYHLFARQWDAVPVAVRRLATFVMVTLGWVLFRAADLSTAGHILGLMIWPFGTSQTALSSGFVACVIAAGLVSMLAPNVQESLANFKWQRWRSIAYPLAFGACLALIASSRNSPFLYFQF